MSPKFKKGIWKVRIRKWFYNKQKYMYDLWLSKSRSHRHCVRQITVIGGTRYFTTTKSKWKTAFCVPLLKNFREQRNIWKGGPVFPDEIFQTVRCLQSAFSPKTRLVLISSSAIANHDVIITINFAKKNKRLLEIYPNRDSCSIC